MSTYEIEAYVQAQAEENPAIDIDAFHEDSARKRLEWLNSFPRSRGTRLRSESRDDDDSSIFDAPIKSDSGQTLYESLHIQLLSYDLDAEEALIGRYLIGCTDSHGYLSETPEDVAACLKLSEEKVCKVMHIMRSLQPTGVCSENMCECLCAQVEGLPDEEQMKLLIRNYLPELAKGHFQSVARQCGIHTEAVVRLFEKIKQLDPYPSAGFASKEEPLYIIPDVIIRHNDGVFDISLLNSYYSSLDPGSYYLELYSSTDDDQVKEYLKKKFDSIEWIKKCLMQREQTLLRCIRTILDIQREFFESPSGHLVPMTMQNVAEALNISISTVSRSIRGKYLQCEKGLLPIKSLFSSRIKQSTGAECSSDKVHSDIYALISSEAPSTPLSDQQITDILNGKGYKVSRKTVAKYREDLGIASSYVRKQQRYQEAKKKK